MSSGALLSLAGYDPTAGAGVTMDLRVFAVHGYWGMGLCTAMTVQNTKRVKRLSCLSPDVVWEQYRTLKEDTMFRGIKIGMLGSRDHISNVARILEQESGLPIVVDPVLRSSSGTRLLEKEALPEYMAVLAGKIRLLTPNLDEAAEIAGMPVDTLPRMRAAAGKISHDYGIPCCITGGHLLDRAVDMLYDGQAFHVFEKEKLIDRVHGTGCFFSSTALCMLVHGLSLPEACRQAGRKTLQAIKKSRAVGKGQRLILPDGD
jgi:hydroxymethylpyrimidine/phosphomethylpyrimidine kinase